MLVAGASSRLEADPGAARRGLVEPGDRQRPSGEQPRIIALLEARIIVERQRLPAEAMRITQEIVDDDHGRRHARLNASFGALAKPREFATPADLA
jgi:ribonuclease PH